MPWSANTKVLVDANDPFFHVNPYKGGWIVTDHGEHIGSVKKLKAGWTLNPTWAVGNQKARLERACALLDAHQAGQ